MGEWSKMKRAENPRGVMKHITGSRAWADCKDSGTPASLGRSSQEVKKWWTWKTKRKERLKKEVVNSADIAHGSRRPSLKHVPRYILS